MALNARQWLDRIHELPLATPLRIMNVCGGHERSISSAGLRSVLPDNIELIPGPGCPVCVCPEEDVYEAIQIALNEDVILLAFGDMLRVPVNVPRSQARTLEQARTKGADIRPVSSPMEAVSISINNPDRSVVFFAAGFETTMAPIAAMIAQGAPDNLKLLLSGRLTWPAVAMLLDSQEKNQGKTGLDCLVAPGHVATVMGSAEWEFVARKHGLPVAVAGFTSESLLAAFYSVIRQHLEAKPFLDNCYPELVSYHGNPVARQQLTKVMKISNVNWRGIGIIPDSGFSLRPEYHNHDARLSYPGYGDISRKRAGMMPPGCDCSNVVLGKIYPTDCTLYGKACTPRNPVGPCMVSDEGACHIWWSENPNQNTVKRETSGAI